MRTFSETFSRVFEKSKPEKVEVISFRAAITELESRAGSTEAKDFVEELDEVRLAL